MAHLATSKIYTPEEALKKIDLNSYRSFDWYLVRNKTGAIFELGGNHKELFLAVPSIDNDGKIETYHNGYIKTVFSLRENSNIDDVQMSNEEIRKIALTKNVNKYKVEIKEKKVITYETYKVYKFK